MVKLALMKFESNLAYSLWGRKRENFKKGTQVVVAESEVVRMLRLGCTLVWKFVVDYDSSKKVVDDLVKEFEKSQEKEETVREKELERRKKLAKKDKEEKEDWDDTQKDDSQGENK